ncbi:hypothetical protein [Streptomyces olivaceus]|uniref:hypothetical protein n=1 Tax=Streptomyces olivaceus TaxID=47716 RepID=UPI001CCCFCB1|nr:hypothetical protein [Streptomyces olivaceus]
MRAAPARLWRHLGWRGLALAGVGSCWTVYGAGLIVTTRSGVAAATSPVTGLMCMEAGGAVWIACGLLAVVAGARRPGRDVWGFAAVTLPPAVWLLAFTIAAVTGEYGSGWASAPLFAAVLLLVVIVAALTGGRRRVCTCERGGHSER